ncbi:MAG: OmcA/MtrC family decaheme c-type cytochrome, partial [Polyangiaceae bacterium]|nr:OmcA/MtrC family decaheme c-type cytochrome [Polyangiaceae bacterium]
TVAGAGFPNPDGTQAEQAYRETTGTVADHGDGTYTYTFATDISNVTTPVTNTPVPYEAGVRHRLSIMMGGHAGPTASANYDFVPDGTPLANVESRAIVETATCQNCHGWQFAGHGGDRLQVENCVTCHAPGSVDAQSGNTIDFKTMIHKIHAGGELASIPGADGIVWDNPGTVADESADNGEYAIYGYQNTKFEWWKADFPAVIENCTKCHTGAGAEVANYKNVPSRAVCGSCHAKTSFVSPAPAGMVLHSGGQQLTDNACAACHSAGSPIGVDEAHDWMAKFATDDPRNTPEFSVDLSMTPPANGTHYVNGEAPVVTLVLHDLENGGAVIDHSNLTAETSSANYEGCVPSGNPLACPAKDGLLAASNFFVQGPRGNRGPVLTTRARMSRITSSGPGPFDLTGASATLEIKFDAGLDVYSELNGGVILRGAVSVPVVAASFVNVAAATVDEMVTWLNANAAFKARGIAWKEANGNLSIRSRNLGNVYSVQLTTGAANVGRVCTVAFAVAGVCDSAVKVPSSTANSIAKQASAANNDPKVTWNAANIQYQLDPVDDLEPGTYVVSVEIGDRGRKTATDYKTPSVAKLTFNVKQATEEAPPARNCNSCHQNDDGKGFILDFSRHYKIFDDTAVDQCGACHDYQPTSATGEWSGGHPIAKRVHAVHNGSNLNYPLATVAYSNGDPVPGRNWDITFPQDIRNCETCHSANASDSWVTEAARLPCWGCHDSDADRAHFKAQVYDPTPNDPWSGDEEESCQVCH